MLGSQITSLNSQLLIFCFFFTEMRNGNIFSIFNPEKVNILFIFEISAQDYVKKCRCSQYFTVLRTIFRSITFFWLKKLTQILWKETWNKNIHYLFFKRMMNFYEVRNNYIFSKKVYNCTKKLYNLNNVKNTHGGVLLLVKLQAKAYLVLD